MFITSLVIGLLLGLSFGFTSNGMTSPRSAFNLYTVPATTIVCGIIGIVVGLFTGDVAGSAFAAAGGGFFGGLVGLLIARARRRMG